MSLDKSAQIQEYFKHGELLGVPQDRCKTYLSEAQGDPALALTTLLIKESERKETVMPTKYYNQPTEEELHQAELDEAKKIGDWIQNYFDENPHLH